MLETPCARACLSLIVAAAVTALSGCVTRPAARYDCVRANAAPVLDGDLSDPCWAQAAAAEVVPASPLRAGAGSPVRFRLLWDDVYLYFAAEVHDATPRAVGACHDDRVWEGDCFELYLNPGNRSGEYYEMDFNAKGSAWDSLWLRHRPGGSRTLVGWNAASLECRTREQPDGWTLEGRVRLDEFADARHTPPWHGDPWRFNANYLDAPAAGGAPMSFSFRPTEELGNTDHFGTLCFQNPQEAARVKAQRRLARDYLSSGLGEDAESLAERLGEVVVTAKSGAAFLPASKGEGWAMPQGFGRLTRRAPKTGEPPATCRARPAGAGDPMFLDFSAWKTGTLLLIGRLDDGPARLVEAGDADGVWVEIEAAGKRVAQMKLTGTTWQAEAVPVPRDQPVRLTVGSGPAANLTGDAAILGLYLIRTIDDSPAPLAVEGWEPTGDVACIHSESAASTRVDAGDAFAGQYRWVPHQTDHVLYRITGRIRTDLIGATRAHVGVDYYTEKREFIRQACTRAPLSVHLRWGLYNVSGRTAWHRFVAYAYDVPKTAAWLKLWYGVNAWETPDASGSAWFDDVRVEAVAPNPAYPLGFPPARYQSECPSEWPPEARQDGYVISVISPLEYVLPECLPPIPISAREISTFSLPGWKEPATFLVHALRNVTGVKVQVSDLIGPGGRVAADHITVRQVRYIYKNRDLVSNEYLLSPNHLETFDAVDITAHRTQQFWLTVDVPTEARAGRYEGKIRIIPADAPSRELRLVLDILPVRVKEPDGIIFGMYSYYGKRDNRQKLMPEFLDMRDHGMTSTFSFDSSLRIPVEKVEGGSARILWNDENQLSDLLDAYARAGFRAPLHLIAPLALFKAAEAHGGPCGTDAFSAVYRDLWRQVLTEKQRHGWPDFVVAPYDEGYPYPFTEERFQRTRALSAALRAVGIPIAVHAVNHPTRSAVKFEQEFYGTADEILLTFCHPPATVAETYRGFADWTAYRSRVQGDGKKLLFYNPDCTGVHPEAMRFTYGVGLWNRQADGVMDWHYHEPHRDGGYGISRVQGSAVLNFTFPPFGEFSGGPTIGWEGVREGAKDYALLHTLRILTEHAAQSSDPNTRAAGGAAFREVDAFLSRLNFATIDSTGMLSMPARFEHESWGEDGVKVLSGDFKVRNGFAREDYNRLRRLVCEHILRLSAVGLQVE